MPLRRHSSSGTPARAIISRLLDRGAAEEGRRRVGALRVEVLLEAGANPMRTMRTDNENNKGKHAIDIAELYNRKGEGSIKDLLYDYKEKRRLERIAKGDYQRKGIPPDRKGKYEL